MLRPGVLLHVYGFSRPIRDTVLGRSSGFAGVIDDDEWSYLVFVRDAGDDLERLGLIPDYRAELLYERWLDGEMSESVEAGGLRIVPPWCEPVELGERTLLIEPSLAFGTGAHPTTRRCLDMIARLFDHRNPPRTVLDLGCGTGLLGLAALKLGAESSKGCDLSRLAVDVARANAERNRLDDRAVFFRRAAAEMVEAADLVLANLPPGALDEILSHPSMRGGRWTIVSGMLESHAERLVRELPAPLEVLEISADGHWRTILIGMPGA